MTLEQLKARFTRHPNPEAQQDKAGTAHDGIASAAALFAFSVLEVVPSHPVNEAGVRDVLSYIDGAVDSAVAALEPHLAEPVPHVPALATKSEATDADQEAHADPEAHVEASEGAEV